ncbi:MAG: type transport system ATP-binding protein [Solirubrobacterales bacterium]|jgi:dienelactone hydrolase|nr:type transport system ATP-binding protein [Solirubrobacterales bacterium]
MAAAAEPLGFDCAPRDELRECSGLVDSWDGIPLDATVVLPPGRAKDLPLVTLVHGFGNSKYEYLDPASEAYTGNAYTWARRGYAVLAHTARGLWGSCGTPEARLASAVACIGGYLHLADVRYEVRDTQELIAQLVDEGVADPERIGVTGDSYGGGQSLMMAALRNRIMLPDGSYAPWRTPEGTPISLAGAAPVIPWTDLVTAAAPNGSVSSTRPTSRKRATTPVGVEKASVVNAIFLAAEFAIGPGQPIGEPFVPGRPMGFLAPAGTDPEADVAAWVTRTDLGEPYDDESARSIVDLLADYHSAYYLRADRPPPPLFLAAGMTDDLFPADETLRFANRTRRKFPGLPLSVMLGDFGHQRASNKPAERERLVDEIDRWFARYVRGDSPTAAQGVTATTQRCPRDGKVGRTFTARTFAALARDKRVRRFDEAATVTSVGGDPAVAAAIDPAAGMGDGCVTTTRSEAPGTARYELKAAGRKAFTLIGAPRLRARLGLGGAAPGTPQLVARLWDVAPGGTQQLVARALYRPAEGRNRWELHPNGWRFRRDHAAELELLGTDAPYARPSNGTFSIDIQRLRVTLPTR